MSNAEALAAFKASVDARDSSSVLRVTAALQAARGTIMREGKMLFLQCAGGTIPEDIEGLLAEWDYQAIARIPASNTVCFARAGAVSSSDSGSSTHDGSVLENLQGQAKSLLRRNPTLRKARNFALDVRGRRPKSLRDRKLNKLLTTPEQFLADSSHEVLSGPALRAFKAMRPALPKADVTLYELPTATLVLCLGAESELRLGAVAQYSGGLSLATELVVVLSAEHAETIHAVLGALRCPRVRVYVLPSGGAGEMIRYGLSRAYADIVGIIAHETSGSSAEIESAFARISETRDHFYDGSLKMVAARRDVWRDHFAGQRQEPALKAGVQELLRAIGAVSADLSDPIAKLDGVSDFIRYASIDPYQPFASHGTSDIEITCFERKPVWQASPPKSLLAGEPLISVVMTTFNSAETVGAAIDSVLRQTYARLELIAVDDCSTDDTLDVLRARAEEDDRLRILQTTRNSGTYFAKNVGMRFARGTFVSFHDSDDVSSPIRLELQAVALACDPNAIGNYTRYQRLTEDGREVWLDGATHRPGYITLMLRREEALKAVGYFDSVRAAADAEYVDRLVVATGRPVRLLPMVTYYALQAEGSLTTAGATAFAVDSEGRTTMPEVRKQYSEAAKEWHETIFERESSAVMPFPLRERPFRAPRELRVP